MPRVAEQSFIRKPLTWILASNANLAVLRELCLHGHELSSSQIIRRTGLSASSVREALGALEETEIITRLGAEKSRLYRIEASRTLVSHIVAMFREESDRFLLIRQAIAAAAQATRDVQAAWIYGSVARSADRPDSDLDIAILATAAPDRRVVSFRNALAPAQDKLGFRPSVVAIEPADMSRLAAEAHPWWENVVTEAIAVYGRTPAACLREMTRTSAATP